MVTGRIGANADFYYLNHNKNYGFVDEYEPKIVLFKIIQSKNLYQL